MGSYPSTVYYVDIFTLASCKMCLKKTKNKRKSGRGLVRYFSKKQANLILRNASYYKIALTRITESFK